MDYLTSLFVRDHHRDNAYKKILFKQCETGGFNSQQALWGGGGNQLLFSSFTFSLFLTLTLYVVPIDILLLGCCIRFACTLLAKITIHLFNPFNPITTPPTGRKNWTIKKDHISKTDTPSIYCPLSFPLAIFFGQICWGCCIVQTTTLDTE